MWRSVKSIRIKKDRTDTLNVHPVSEKIIELRLIDF